MAAEPRLSRFRRLWLRACLPLLAGLGFSPWSAANPLDVRAVATLRVNGMDAGAIVIVLRGADILVAVADLQSAGLRLPAGSREDLRGEAHVSILSLAPEVRFSFDEKELILRLEAPPSAFAPTVIDLEVGPPEGALYGSDSSGFFNYSVKWSRSERFSGFGEAGWSFRNNLIYSSVLRDSSGAFVRGFSRLEINDRPRLRRWTLGDTFVETGELGGGAFLAGASLSRNFDLDPYFVRFPRFGLSGAVSAPSTVDVYVNGSLVRKEEIPPGQFDLRNLPVATGTGSVRLVVRDVFGQERAIASPYYFSTGLLAPGLSDYSYGVGFEREQIGKSSANYGRAILLARHRRGISNFLTLGGRFEAAPEFWSGGASAAARLPLGELDAAAAASSRKGDGGAAASLAYTYIGPRLSFAASVRAMSPRYANASLSPDMDRARIEENFLVGVQVIRRLSLGAQYSSARLRDARRRDAASVSATFQVAPPANLFFSVGRTRTDQKEWAREIFAGLTWALGTRTTANAMYDSRQGATYSTLQVQQTPPRGVGLGYRMQARAGEGRQDGSGLFQYQTAFGRYEFSYERLATGTGAALSASGGVVAIGGGLYATRPVQDGFALLRVPGVSGVRAFSNNQEVGRTTSRGDLLVPDLLPYYGNRLSISDKDVPMDYAIDATERVVAPPSRGGTIVSFPVRRIRTLTGTAAIRRDGQETIPSYGQITVTFEGGRAASPIARDGEFSLENLPPGIFPAKIEYREGTCSFLLSVPASAGGFVDLGRVVCRQP